MNLILALVFSLVALAAPKKYQFDVRLVVDGKIVSTKTYLLGSKKGEASFTGTNKAETSSTATSDENYSVKFNYLAEKKNTMTLDFDISYTAGGKTLAAKPRIKMKVGSEASVADGLANKGELKIIVAVNESKAKDISQIVSHFEDEGHEFATMPMSADDMLEELEMSNDPAIN